MLSSVREGPCSLLSCGPQRGSTPARCALGVRQGLAWRAWGGGGARPLVETILDPGDNAGGLAIFLQQVSFLHCSLLGRTALGVEEAASKIRRACDRGNTRSMWDEGGSDSEEEPSELSGEEVRDSWTSLPIAPTCPQCGGMGSVHHCVQASVEPAMQAMPRGGGEVTLRPVCTEAVQPGTVLALLFANTPIAGWLAPGREWWPRRRRTGVAQARARWQVGICSCCGAYRVTLLAVHHPQQRDEVTVDSNPSPVGEEAGWPWEVTFDGGARGTREGPLAGAGAVLLRHRLGGGGPVRVAQSVVAIPWGATAQVAEAHGYRAASGLLRHAEGPPKRARIVGDNLAVIR